MKKLFFILATLIITVSVSAQSNLGLSVGGGFVNEFFVLNDHPNDNLDNSYYFGPYIEVGYDWNIEKMHGCYVGVRYEFLNRRSAMGSYIPDPYYPYMMTFVGCDANTYRHFFDIPVKYRFNWEIGSAATLFFDLGPTFNFMAGNVTYLSEYTPMLWASQKIDWYKAAPNAYNWFNLSVGLNAGVFVGQAKIFIGYDYGGILSYTKENIGRGQVHQLRIGAAYVF